MKKLFLIFFILFALRVDAQDYGAVGSEWYYGFRSPDALAGSPDSYVYVKSVSDTVILGKTAHRIDIHPQDTWITNTLFVYQQGDTAFYYSETRNKFLSMYIFNRNAGDTLTLDAEFPMFGATDTTYRIVKEAVTTETIDGVDLKKYKVKALDHFEYFGNYYMDIIGGLGWYMPMGPVVGTGSYGPIRCFTDNQINHSFVNYACNAQLPTATHDFLEEPSFQVYPNPFTNRLTVKFSNQEQTPTEITLHNLQGQKIYASQPNSNGSDEIKLALPAIPAGLYFLHVSGQKHSYTVKLRRE